MNQYVTKPADVSPRNIQISAAEVWLEQQTALGGFGRFRNANAHRDDPCGRFFNDQLKMNIIDIYRSR
jgi:hypothetical protein